MIKLVVNTVRNIIHDQFVGTSSLRPSQRKKYLELQLLHKPRLSLYTVP